MTVADLLFRRCNTAASCIFWGTLLPFLLGVAAWLYWRATGSIRAVDLFFQFVSPVVMLALALAQMALAFRAWRWFRTEQTMWVVWGCLTLAGAAQFTGAVFSQLLGVKTPLNPMGWLAANPDVRGFGSTLAGPVALTLLLIAFSIAIAVYRSFGWKALPRWYDIILLSVVAVFVLRQAWELLIMHPHQVRLTQIVPWLTDPILLVAGVLAFTLWRSAGSSNGGLTGLCWGCYGIGLFLTAIGDISHWAVRSQQMSWEHASLVNWDIWLPAYAAFALGPACQLEAVRVVRENGG